MALRIAGAGWIKQGAKAKYISAQLITDDKVKINFLIFKNTRKQKEGQPDYIFKMRTLDEVQKGGQSGQSIQETEGISGD